MLTKLIMIRYFYDLFHLIIIKFILPYLNTINRHDFSHLQISEFPIAQITVLIYAVHCQACNSESKLGINIVDRLNQDIPRKNQRYFYNFFKQCIRNMLEKDARKDTRKR